jgi:hypothetical protein
MNDPNVVPYIDLPDVREIFADNVRVMMFNDGVLRMELTVTRTGEFNSPTAQPQGRAYPAARLAITTTAALQMHGHLTRMLDSLEKQGLIHRNAVAAPAVFAPPTPPKH